jgi:hypothetical protein
MAFCQLHTCMVSPNNSRSQVRSSSLWLVSHDYTYGFCHHKDPMAMHPQWRKWIQKTVLLVVGVAKPEFSPDCGLAWAVSKNVTGQSEQCSTAIGPLLAFCWVLSWSCPPFPWRRQGYLLTFSTLSHFLHQGNSRCDKPIAVLSFL